MYEDKEARKRVFPHEPQSDDQRVEVARRNVEEFAAKAFRRPVSEAEKERLFGIMRFAWQRDSSEAEIFKTVIAAILSSPHFIFRIEQDPDPQDNDGIRAAERF